VFGIRFAWRKVNSRELWVWLLLGRLCLAAWLTPSKKVIVKLPRGIPLADFEWNATGILIESACGVSDSLARKRFWLILKQRAPYGRRYTSHTRLVRVRYREVATLLYLAHQERQSQMDRIFYKVTSQVCAYWEVKGRQYPGGLLSQLEGLARRMKQPAAAGKPFVFACKP
jgi:hypothetical protein